MSPSPGPALTGRTSICSRKLSSPNRSADHLPDPRTDTRAGFAEVSSISVVVVLRQRLISRLADPDPVQAIAAAAACHSDRRRAQEHPPELPAWVGRLL